MTKTVDILKLSIISKTGLNTESQIAKAIGVSQGYVAMLLNGQRTPKNLKKLLRKIDLLTTNNLKKALNNSVKIKTKKRSTK